MRTLGRYLFCGMIVLGLSIFLSVRKFKSYDRTVFVKGAAEREVLADKVIWPIQFTELGNNLTAIYEGISAKKDLVVDFLVSNGISREEITVAPPKVNDRNANQYSANMSSFRYDATCTITVSSFNVEQVRSCINKQMELLKLGVSLTTNEYGYDNTRIHYSFSSLNEIKPEMIEEATKNARAAAEKFAKDSRSHIGKIKSANQGQITVSDRDENTSHIKRVRVVTSIEYYLK